MWSLVVTYAVRGAVTVVATMTTKDLFTKVKNEVNDIHEAREARRKARSVKNTPSTNKFGPEVKS